ncbi:hypothetical protein [Martelella mediterranea]|uniref:Uncharacterized protein n=1 Tax=Martelella mediterranea TaxID=293089 RepID=A0A4R3NJ73_9HYPH|nr:hypothetical protein [Martelella mediterranea]TCT34758.1 hypothetical protein EDC90_10302 [Martelella mediterranea]
MQKTAMMAIMSTALLASATVAAANDNMSEDQCLAIMMAMSKLEISMIGKVPFGQASAALAEVQPSLPASVTPTVDDLIVVAEKAQGFKTGDPAHPMATGEFQTANRRYREALAPYCPDFNLDY